MNLVSRHSLATKLQPRFPFTLTDLMLSLFCCHSPEAAARQEGEEEEGRQEGGGRWVEGPRDARSGEKGPSPPRRDGQGSEVAIRGRHVEEGKILTCEREVRVVVVDLHTVARPARRRVSFAARDGFVPW